jgi:hypothetical protein
MGTEGEEGKEGKGWGKGGASVGGGNCVYLPGGDRRPRLAFIRVSSIESEKSSFESEKSREARGEAAVTGAGTAGRRAQTRAGHGHGLGEAPVGRTGFCRRPALHARS